MRVLVVDGDESSTSSIQEWALAGGHTASVARTIEEGKKLARLGCPDLAICAAQFVEGPGEPLVEYLHLMFDNLPILMTARTHSAAGVAECIRAGATDMLLPPFQASKINQVVGPLLERRQGLPSVTRSIPAVLYVDDDVLTLRFTGLMLGSQGLKPVLVKNLAEARTALKDGDFDVVIVDMFLGQELGLDLMDELIRDARDCPVIVVTGRDDPQVLLGALRRGAAAVFLKPLDRDALFVTVQRLYRARVAASRAKTRASELSQARVRIGELESSAPGAASPANADGGDTVPAAVLEALPSGVIVISGDGVVRGLNRVGRTLLGLDETFALGRPFAETAALAPFAAAVQQVRSTGESVFQWEKLIRVGRVERTLGIGAGPIPRPGAPPGVVLTFQDITAKKRNEADQQRSDRLASFGMVARSLIDEIAQPIGRAVATTDIVLHDSAVRVGSRLHLERLKFALQRVDHLANRVARLLADRDPEITPCDVNNVINEVVTFLGRRFFMGSHSFLTELAAASPYVMGDPIEIEHLVMMLVVGLVESSPTGTRIQLQTLNHMGVLEVRVGRQVDEATETLLAEIPELAELEEPDEAPEQDEASIGSATGKLGLLQCRLVANRMGGQMKLDAGVGPVRGCMLRLPAASQDDCIGFDVKVQSGTQLQREGRRGSKTVLLLAKRAEVVDFCLEWINTAGFRVTHHETPASALAAAEVAAPDLLLVHLGQDNPDWMDSVGQFARFGMESAVLLLDSKLKLKRLGDHSELMRYRTLQLPLSGRALVQALAMAELDGGRLSA